MVTPESDFLVHEFLKHEFGCTCRLLVVGLILFLAPCAAGAYAHVHLLSGSSSTSSARSNCNATQRPREEQHTLTDSWPRARASQG